MGVLPTCSAVRKALYDFDQLAAERKFQLSFQFRKRSRGVVFRGSSKPSIRKTHEEKR